MGVSLIYQALPEQSDLCVRLKSDEKIAIVFDAFFNYGAPFSWANTREDFDDEALDALAEHSGVVSSRSEVDECLTRIVEMLGEIQVRYPGIEERAAFLDKTHHDIQSRLSQEFQRVGDQVGIGLVGILIAGETQFWPDIALRYISASRVAEGAQVLRGIEPESLFPAPKPWEERALDDYRSWRMMFLNASEAREVVIVGL